MLHRNLDFENFVVRNKSTNPHAHIESENIAESRQFPSRLIFRIATLHKFETFLKVLFLSRKEAIFHLFQLLVVVEVVEFFSSNVCIGIEEYRHEAHTFVEVQVSANTRSFLEKSFS